MELVDGIDLSDPLNEVKKVLKEKAMDVEKLLMCFIWVFLTWLGGTESIAAYKQQPDYDALREVNIPLMRRTVEAIHCLSPNLEHLILQTGGKVTYPG